MSSKKVLILPLLLLSACKSDFVVVEASELFTFSNELITPIQKDEKKYIGGSITYNGYEELNNITVLAIATYKAGEYEFRYTYLEHPFYDLVKGKKMHFEFELPDASYYLDKEIDIELSVYDYDNNLKLDTRYLKARGPLKEEINVDDYRLSPLEINRFTTISGKEVEEYFLFNHIENDYVLSSYHRIDPSIFSFIYHSDYPLTIKKAYLSFIDNKNLFPTIKAKENGYKELELDYHQDEENITFSFNNLYVEPNTLDVSNYSINTYQKTKYLYLPRNKQESFNGYIFYLNIEDIGLNEISIHHEMSFRSNRPLIGSCDSAYYCIVGGRYYE